MSAWTQQKAGRVFLFHIRASTHLVLCECVCEVPFTRCQIVGDAAVFETTLVRKAGISLASQPQTECALRGVRTEGDKCLTIFGQHLRPHIWSKLLQIHSFLDIKRSPGSSGYSPKTQGCVIYANSYALYAILTTFGARYFGQKSPKSCPP